MSIEKLRILTETTFDGFPDKSIERFVKDAVAEHDALKDLFSKLVPSLIITDGMLLSNPDVYNQIVEVLNKGVVK